MENQLIVTLTVEDLKRIIAETIEMASKPHEEEVLLTRKEVASLFKVSLVTINQWMREGRLKFCRVNSRVYFKRNQILESLQETSFIQISPKKRFKK